MQFLVDTRSESVPWLSVARNVVAYDDNERASALWYDGSVISGNES